jgi:hypothetical protein
MNNWTHLNKRLMLNIVAIGLVLGGWIYLSLPKLVFAIQPDEAAKQATAEFTAPVDSKPAPMELGKPTTILLPRLKMKLDILPGEYRANDGSWRIDTSHAFYMAPDTISPGLPATPMIYGHELPAIFAKLQGVEKDELLVIKNAAGRQLYFRYSGDKIVSPTDDSVLRNHIANSILLLTCNGVASENRRVLQFDFVESH